MLGDLAARRACLDRPRASVELEAEVVLVGLEQRAVTHVELEDGCAEGVGHVRSRHDKRFAAEKAEPLEQHDVLRLGQVEHPRHVRGDGLDLEAQDRRLEPLTAAGQILVEAGERLGDELGDLRRGDERAPPF